MFLRRLTVAAATLALVGAVGAAPTAQAAASVPRFDHIVLVMFENKASSQITASSAPYFQSLAAQGASFSQSYAITHPSQPNYIALFSGSTQGVTSDACPKTFSANNLGAQLIAAGLTFKGYSESMPSNGYTGCSSGTYIRSLARDLGKTLGTGGHLTRLRRTRVGGYRAEDARTLDHLIAIDCQLVQGYYLSRPIPPDELGAWMAHRRATLAASASRR